MLRPFTLTLLLLLSTLTLYGLSPELESSSELLADKDSTLLVELDLFWKELARTVREGDHEGYMRAYHEDAVVIFASGEKKVSMPISRAMESWKQGFIDTKNGSKRDHVEFRFSQRIYNEETAHETGIFIFTSADGDGNVQGTYITHFEMLLIKRDGKWLALMEHQRAEGTEEEWKELQY